MTQHPNPTFLRMLPVLALLAPVLAAPASAQAGKAPAPAAKDLSTLDRAARQKIWCVERKAAQGRKKTRQCKTREAWIQEGNDPLREF